MPRGKYIVIEGNDGTGKSTQIEILQERLYADHAIESELFHEPAGSPISDAIRDIIKDKKLDRDSRTDLLLFTAARHELWKKINRLLESGVWVLSARNFFSTVVYQGRVEGIPFGEIQALTEKYTDKSYMFPDLALILDLDNISRTNRMHARGEEHKKDYFESKDVEFQYSISKAYREIADELEIPLIDASDSKKAVADQIWTHLTKKIHIS